MAGYLRLVGVLENRLGDAILSRKVIQDPRSDVSFACDRHVHDRPRKDEHLLVREPVTGRTHGTDQVGNAYDLDRKGTNARKTRSSRWQQRMRSERACYGYPRTRWHRSEGKDGPKANGRSMGTGEGERNAAEVEDISYLP